MAVKTRKATSLIVGLIGIAGGAFLMAACDADDLTTFMIGFLTLVAGIGLCHLTTR